jgi:hypothetical protein
MFIEVFLTMCLFSVSWMILTRLHLKH